MAASRSPQTKVCGARRSIHAYSHFGSLHSFRHLTGALHVGRCLCLAVTWRGTVRSSGWWSNLGSCWTHQETRIFGRTHLHCLCRAIFLTCKSNSDCVLQATTTVSPGSLLARTRLRSLPAAGCPQSFPVRGDLRAPKAAQRHAGSLLNSGWTCAHVSN